MKPTNLNANKSLVMAINHLAIALPARKSKRAESIAFALAAIHESLSIQPDTAKIVERVLDSKNITFGSTDQ